MYSLYRALTVLTTPLLPLLLQWRLRHGKEDAARMGERLGKGQEARGKSASLLWIHAASMGESASILPLVDAFLKRYPDWRVMVTTVTVTSAKLMAQKLPAQAFHQFAPLDNPIVLKRFFARWQPQLAFWVESELWPNMAKMTPCPMYLINARMSERSFRRWQKAPALLREMLGCFTAIFPQSEGDGERFQSIVQGIHRASARRDLSSKSLAKEEAAAVAEGVGGASPPHIQYLGNLKYDAPPLSCDEAELARLREAIGNRPVWLAASTHPGEEEQIAEVHEALTREFPNLLTIIVPRHAPRGNAIAAMLRGRGFSVTQRSQGHWGFGIGHSEKKANGSLTEQARGGEAVGVAGGGFPLQEEIYLADTMGELGLFYRLSHIVFIGGSLVPHGGQNLLEPARLECAILCGAHMHNFAAVTAEMQAAGAVQQVADAQALQQAVATLLRDAALRQEMASRAAEAVQKHNGMVDALLNYLSHRERSKSALTILGEGQITVNSPSPAALHASTSPTGRGVLRRTPTFWQSRGILSTLLLPLSWLYVLAGWLRWQCITPRKVAVPVICVGNAVAGGAGKTPVAMAIAALLQKFSTPTEQGEVNFISRGYGGKPQAMPVQVQPIHTAADVGDEPLLLAQVAPCWVHVNRVKAAEAAVNEGATALIMDDGLQNPSLYKDVTLLVVDGATGFGNGRVMPAGALREPIAAAMHKVDAMIIVGENKHNLTHQTLFTGSLIPTQPLSPLPSPAVAFAGIGRPEKFFTMLREGGVMLAEAQAFPDHHAYTTADIAGLRALGIPLLTTAKDAVKLPEDFRREVNVVEVEFQFDDAEEFARWLISKLS